MRVTIDDRGRLVIPAAAREALGFVAGAELQFAVRAQRLEIALAPVGVGVAETDGVAVLVPERPQPPLTVERVRALLERERR